MKTGAKMGTDSETTCVHEATTESNMSSPLKPSPFIHDLPPICYLQESLSLGPTYTSAIATTTSVSTQSVLFPQICQRWPMHPSSLTPARQLSQLWPLARLGRPLHLGVFKKACSQCDNLSWWPPLLKPLSASNHPDPTPITTSSSSESTKRETEGERARS